MFKKCTVPYQARGCYNKIDCLSFHHARAMHVEVHEYTLKLGTGVCEKNNHPDRVYAHLITHLHF